MDASQRAAAEEAADRLLPRVGAPVARRWAQTPVGRVHYLEAGSGPPVVLLHGGFGGAGNWYRTIGPLALRFRVLAPDRPGFGLFDGAAAPHAPDWLHHFLSACDVPRGTLVGHGAGGAVALDYAHARPAAVSALVLSDVALVATPGDRPAVRTKRAAIRAAAAAINRRAVAPGSSADQGAGGADASPAESSATPLPARRPPAPPRRPEAWYASLAARFDDRRLLAPDYLYYLWCLAQLRPGQEQRPPGEVAPGPIVIPGLGERTWPALPTLLIWGRGNRWTGVPVARQLHQRIPDAWLRVIDHSKGIPNLEQPGEFNHALINFLATAARQ